MAILFNRIKNYISINKNTIIRVCLSILLFGIIVINSGYTLTYLQSDTFHDELVKLPQAETVPYFQGSGTDYGFASTSKIDIKKSDGTTITVNGVIGVMFDHDALGVCNRDRRVTTHYNAKAEFYNNYYKFDAEYFNDLNENFVVFFVA